jgi:PAS domain S-box-containing protein
MEHIRIHLVVRYIVAVFSAALTHFLLEWMEKAYQGFGIPLILPLTILVILTFFLGSGPALAYGLFVGIDAWHIFVVLKNTSAPANPLETLRFAGYFVTAAAILTGYFLLMRTQKKLQYILDEGRRTQEALQESEERFRGIFEHTPLGMLQTNSQWRITLVNKAFAVMLGFAPGDLIGLSVRELTHPEDLIINNRLNEDMLAGKRSYFRIEKRFRHRDGHYVWVDLSAFSFRDVTGKNYYSFGVVQDITERKFTEEALRESKGHLAELNRTLEQQVEQRTHELKTKDMELERSRRLEVIGQMAGGIAHDFNNLLTGIAGIVEGVRSEISDFRLREDLEEAANSCNRASHLTHQLLTFGRRQPVITRMLDLNEVISSMKSLLRRLLPENIELQTNLGPQIGLVRADRGQMEQVLMNLVLNARDAIRNGGRIVIETASAGSRELALHSDLKPGAYAILNVSDTGHGMDQNTINHLFEPFFTTKGPGKGTGMGLAMVYGIVKQSEGDISVYSEPEHGTIFKIILPKIAECRAERRHPDRGQGPGGSETILLVEDEDIVRKVISRALSKRGYHVLEAVDGSQAMNIAEECGSSIQLLLTDLIMPGMNGREVAETLHKNYPGLRVLFMSGHIPDLVMQSGIIDPESSNFIEKSFSMDALGHKVRHVLDQPPTPDPGAG